jgi:non-ribosomal peptide synthetase component F
LNLTLFDRQQAHPDVDRVVGPFTNLALVEIDLRDGPEFATLASRVQASLWESLENRDVCGVWVLREMARQRGAAVQMPVVFTYIDESHGSDFRSVLGRFGEVPFLVSQTPQVLLDCQIAESAESLVVSESAGINRHGEGDERALHRRVSAPRWPRVMRRRPARAWRSVDRGTCRPGY